MCCSAGWSLTLRWSRVRCAGNGPLLSHSRRAPGDMVRLACTKCERRGQYRKTTLIERYGADQNMVDVRLRAAPPQRGGGWGCLGAALVY
jgi:hypothetical protein